MPIRVDLVSLQIIADNLPPKKREAMENAITELAEARQALQGINAVCFDALRPAKK